MSASPQLSSNKRHALLAPELVLERLLHRGDPASLVQSWAQRHPQLLTHAAHEGLTPLMLAASKGRVQSAGVLAQAPGGCTPSPNGMNAFMVAAAEGHLEVMHALLPLFEIDAQADKAGTALAWAVLCGQVPSVQWLLDQPLAQDARQAMIQNAWVWGIAEDDCSDGATLKCAELLAQAAQVSQNPHLATHMLWRAIERNSSQGAACVAPWALLSLPMPQESMSIHSPLSSQLSIDGAWPPLSWCVCHEQWLIAEVLAPFASEGEIDRCLEPPVVAQRLPRFCATRERQALEQSLGERTLDNQLKHEKAATNEDETGRPPRRL